MDLTWTSVPRETEGKREEYCGLPQTIFACVLAERRGVRAGAQSHSPRSQQDHSAWQQQCFWEFHRLFTQTEMHSMFMSELWKTIFQRHGTSMATAIAPYGIFSISVWDEFILVSAMSITEEDEYRTNQTLEYESREHDLHLLEMTGGGDRVYCGLIDMPVDEYMQLQPGTVLKVTSLEDTLTSIRRMPKLTQPWLNPIPGLPQSFLPIHLNRKWHQERKQSRLKRITRTARVQRSESSWSQSHILVDIDCVSSTDRHGNTDG